MFLRGIGRPAIVYGPPCHPDLLAHQVWVTETELGLGFDFARNVPIGKTIADGWFASGKEAFAVEVDNAGKQSRRLLKVKLAQVEKARAEPDGPPATPAGG